MNTPVITFPVQVIVTQKVFLLSDQKFRGCCTGKCWCDRPEIPEPRPLSTTVPRLDQ